MNSLSGMFSSRLGQVAEDPEGAAEEGQAEFFPGQGRKGHKQAGSEAPMWREAGEGFPGAEEFHRAVGEAQRETAEASAAVDRLGQLHERRKHEINAAKSEALQQSMVSEMARIKHKAREIKKSIQSIKKANQACRRHLECGPGSATDRMRTAVTLSVALGLKKVMDKFNELMARMDKDREEDARRRLKTVTGQEPDEAQLKQVLLAGDSRVFLRAAVALQGQEQGRAALEGALLEIEERQTSVQGITTQLAELLQLFEDMAAMVEEQGEILDEVEVTVGEAHVATQTGTKHLEAAEKLRKDTNRWRIFGAAIVVTLILIAAVAAVAAVVTASTTKLYIELGIVAVGLVIYVILGLLYWSYCD